MLILSVLVIAGCSSPTDTTDHYVAVTSLSPLTSITEAIAGSKIEVIGLIPEGENSHEFEPAPSLVTTLEKADVIILNGFNLETHVIELAKTSKKETTDIVLLADIHIPESNYKFDFSFPEENGHPNPHSWTDPMLGLTFAEEIRKRFTDLDPDNSDYYQSNYERFKARSET